jgi:O-antigen/teichoic acid export membrane protein
VPATLVPAAVSFLLIYLYTRLLTPAEYGYFSLAFAVVQFAQTTLFFAIPITLTRYYPEAVAEDRAESFLSDCYMLFYALAGATLVALAVATFSPLVLSLHMWALTAVLIFTRSGITLNQAVNRITFRVARFSVIECSNAVLGLALGLGFISLLGPSAMAVMLGLTLAATICVLVDGRALLLPFRRPHDGFRSVEPLVRFAVPLIGVDLTVCALWFSDRFLLDTLGGAQELGIYAVAFNLVERPVSICCSAITSATFPHAVQVLEDFGAEAGGRQAGTNGAVLFAVLLPACVGLGLLAPAVAEVMVGADFRAGVTMLLPILAVTAFLRGTATHFIDHVFHLTGRTSLALWVYVPSAVANIVLNLALIPRYGMLGAAWAALLSQAGATAAGWFTARSSFPLRIPVREVILIVLATGAMALGLLAMPVTLTWGGLIASVLFGGFTYGACALGMNVGDSHLLMRRLVLRLASATNR